MKTMKVITMLDLVARETFKQGFKFRYDGYIWTYNYNDCIITNVCDDTFSGCYCIEQILNDEVEVIEDTQKIKGIEIETEEDGFEYISCNNDNRSYVNSTDKVYIEKINELIQVVNELTEKIQ